MTDWDRQGHAPSERMAVFATNVAETSLTLPGLRVVVDSGLAKEARCGRRCAGWLPPFPDYCLKRCFMQPR